MKVTWFFDFISPFAYLQHQRFSEFPQNIEIEYCPVLFAGLLQNWEHKGPAEIPSKRIFTYRHTVWLAQRLGIPFRFPPAHPFNPLSVLRLAIALNCDKAAIETIFLHIWREGKAVDEPQGWQELLEKLSITDAEILISQAHVKQQLKQNGECAIGKQVFGVPTFVADDQIFWGFDATDMLLDYVAHPDLLQQPEMRRVSSLPASNRIGRKL